MNRNLNLEKPVSGTGPAFGGYPHLHKLNATAEYCGVRTPLA